MQTINDLRSTLFDTLQAVKEGKMEIDRAKAVSDIAQTIINTAKAEIDYAKATGADIHSGLIETGQKLLPGQSGSERTGSGTKTVTALPGVTVTQHKMRG